MSLDIDPKPLEIPSCHQFEVSSDGLGRYTIDVSLPAGYDASDESYPVVVVLDGNLLFDVAHSILNGRFAAMGSLMPPAIVVGVGYPADEGLASFYGRRNFDFHGDWAMTDELGLYLQNIFTNYKTIEGKPELTMSAGGAPRFMSFLRDELLPGLAEQYRVDPDARHTLIGDSSGGHFVLRALYDQDSPFKKYVCISPGFGSASGSIEELEATYAESFDDLDVDLFICAGDQEAEEGTYALCRIVSGVVWIREQFARRNWPSARVAAEIMNLEDHGSIAPRAIAAGMRFVNQVRPGFHREEIAEKIAAMLPPED